MSFPYQYIAVEGVIGAGKTTVARLLSEKLSARLLTESFADNPFLARFYAEPERYAFPLELSFLAERYQQLKEVLQSADLFGQPLISDYVFQKSSLFARINLKDAEYNLFQTMYRLIGAQLPAPDVLIYLDAPLERLKNNIERRGRSYEQSIPDSYLTDLAEVYRQFLLGYSGRVLRIDMRNTDFLEMPDAMAHLLAQLKESPWEGTRFLRID